MRNGFRVVIACVAALGALVGVVSPATGDTGDSTSQACRAGSRSGVTSISGATLIYDICIEAAGADIDLYLEDTAKDGRRAEAWMVTSLTEYEIFEVTGGKGDWDDHWLFIQEAYVQVKVCSSDANLDRRCGSPV